METLRFLWNLFQAVDPVFRRSGSLPTTEAADHGEYGQLSGPELRKLKNCITELRSDLCLNVLKRNIGDIEDLRAQKSREELSKATERLLTVYESLVDDKIVEPAEGYVLTMVTQTEKVPHDQLASRFPKLFLLRNKLHGYRQSASPKTVPEEPSHPTLKSSACDQDAWLKLTEGLVQFPRKPDLIMSCQEIVYSFGVMLHNAFETPIARWKAEGRAQSISSADVEAIQQAHDFAVLSSSLFRCLAEKLPCRKPHRADIHLSGFTGGQMNTSIRTCHSIRDLSTCFSSPINTDGIQPLLPAQICAPVDGASVSHISFHDATMWETRRTEKPSHTVEPQRLRDILQPDANPGLRDMASQMRRNLGVLLAYSMFRLFDSSWIQVPWTNDSVFLQKGFHSIADDHLQPLISCDLSMTAGEARINSEVMAALGIIIMELDVGDVGARDVDEDLDLEFCRPSFHVRLGRMLYQWKERVHNVYRVISQACHDFESLVQAVDHPKLRPELKRAAVIYKCIFEPLMIQSQKECEATMQMFRGFSGPSGRLGAISSITAAQAAKVVLFDDAEVPDSDQRVGYADLFWEELDPFFMSMNYLKCAAHPIRIAVLDSGVDKTDPQISRHIELTGRIQPLKTFVESPADEDSCGHGTFVTKLLLKAAPAAQIYVAKICDTKNINAKFMPGIAKALDWAISADIDADIISMSFGYEDSHDDIASAIGRASAAGKLLFAAASNRAGLVDGPARPARDGRVICVNATDGKGSSWGYSINPPAKPGKTLATLGVAVRLGWGDRPAVFKCGTSFATPIAAGFAASILEFARSVNYKWTVSQTQLERLHEKEVMEAVLWAMTRSIEHYHFLHPNRFWVTVQDDDSVAAEIEKVIKSL